MKYITVTKITLSQIYTHSSRG